MLEENLDTTPALKEAEALLDRFVMHRPESQANLSGKWKSLALKGSGGRSGRTSSHEFYGSHEPDYSLSEIADLCPSTLRLLDRVTDVSQCERIRFMLLEPGAEISTHSDAPDKPTSLAINIALNMPEECEFWADLDSSGAQNRYSHRIPIQPGCAFLFNSSTYHRLENRSSQNRIHLIAHGPLRHDDQTVLAKAQAAQGSFDARQLTNLVVRKRIEMGAALTATDPLYYDYLNLGAVRDFLPDRISVALMIEALADQSVFAEALAVTQAGLNNVPHSEVAADKLDAWLSAQATQGKHFAAIITAGTFICQPTTFVTSLLKEISGMERKGIPLKGHIIHRPDILPRLHDQFLIVDLRAWRQAGQPSFLPSPETIDFPSFSAAPECVHGDHTPLWIKPSPGETRRGLPKFGAKAMAGFLSAGLGVENISQDLRSEKDYAYPAEGRGENYERVKSRIKSYLSEKSGKVYVFNTEPAKIEEFSLEPNLIIAPCAGLKPFALMNQFNVKAGARILFLDQNQNAVDYFHRLLHCRTNKELWDLMAEELRRQHQLPAEGLKYVKKMFDSFLTEGFEGSAQNFWAHIAAAREGACLRQLNYLNQPEELLGYLRAGDRVLFWHSNVWEYTAAFYERNTAELRENYLRLVERFSLFFGEPARVHTDAYKAVIGAEPGSPRMVMTAGGSKLGAPKLQSYLPLRNLF